MGFSVTASHVIFIVALLGAGTIATNDYWSTANTVDEAKRTQAELFEERIKTNMTISGTPTFDGPDRYTVTLINGGTTRLRVDELTYIVDGTISMDVESITVEGSSTTNLWLPGETLVLTLKPIATEPTHFALVSGNGAAVYYQR